MRLRISPLLLALCLGVARPLPASLWPSASERLEKELAAPDVEQRRRAAARLLTLPEAIARRLAGRALDDPDVEVRLSAVQAAAALDLPGLGDRVVPWLSDGERRLRLAAAEALQGSPSARAVAALGRALSDSDPAVRGAAAGALGASASPEAVLALLGHLDDSVPEVRRDVALALARLGDPRAVVPLIGKIEDGRPLVRRSVARALGELRDARAVSVLVLSLRDADESVRVATVEALGRIGDPNAAPSIISILKSDQSQPVRGAAIEALSRIASPQALDVLVEQLSYDEPGRERKPVLRALARVGERAARALERCLSGQPAADRADGCALGIGEAGAAGGGALIRDALGRGIVRPAAAIEALGMLGDRDALPVVLEYLTDADPILRRIAIAATEALLDPTQPDGRAVEPIVRALGLARTSRAERIELVRLLGRTGSPRAAATLLPIAENADVELRRAAIEAAGMLGAAGQELVLLDALSAEEGAVRLAAALALRRSGSRAAALPLLDLLERAAEQDRGAIGLALAGPLSKSVDPKVLARVERAVRASAGAERDLLIEAMGRIEGPAAVARLFSLAKGGDLFDRAKVAEALAAHAAGTGALVALAGDVDGAVRANAAWALGGVGGPSEIEVLRRLVRDRDVAAAGNAVAALGRVGARTGAPVAAELCAALGDRRSYVRSSALRGLRVAGLRCDGAPERRALARDRSEIVREAAAALLRDVAPADADKRALLRCAEDDPSGAVAATCAGPSVPIEAATEPVAIYVVPIGEPGPVPRAPFALVLENGLMRLGVADRRGAVFEARAPRGEIRLAVPAPLAE